MSFSLWMRNNLLNSWQGLITQDIDYIVFDNDLSSFCILEEKNSMKAPVNIAQAIIFKFLDEYLSLQHLVNFEGCYLVFITQNHENIYLNPQLVRRNNSWSYIMNQLPHVLNFNNFRYLVCNNQNQLRTYYQNWWNPIIRALINKLYDCSGEPPNIPTRSQRTPYRGTYLGNMCKNMKKIDWIFVNYCTGYFILLEEKTHSNGRYRPQHHESQLINLINSIFYESDNINCQLQLQGSPNVVRNPRSNVPYRYLGYYLIEFDNTTPGNSNNIWLNHQLISLNNLISFLNLDSQNAVNIANQYKNMWW